MSIKHSALLLLLAPFMSNVVASELSVGAGVIYNESPWRGYNENTHAVPVMLPTY